MAAPTWQGIVEILLRGITMALGLVILVTGIITIVEVDDLDSNVEEFIDDSDDNHDRFSEVPDTPNLVEVTRSDGGFLIFIGGVVILYEALAITLRVLNLSLENTYIIVLLAIDIVISGVFALIFLITGGITAAYSAAWDDWVDFADEYFIGQTRDDNLNTFEAIRGATGAAAASCILELLAYLGLAGWVLITIILKFAFGSRQGNSAKV